MHQFFNRILRFMPVLLVLPLFSALAGPARAQSLDIKVNFQTPTGASASGYFRDYGQPYDLRTAADQGSSVYSYGWVVPGTTTPLDLSIGGSVPGNGRDRGKNTDQRFDTLMHMQADDLGAGFNGTRAEGAWEIALPNDTYNVTIAAGDAEAGGTNSRHTIRVEGTTVISNFISTAENGSPDRHRVSTVQVAVADGRLTVDALGGFNTKINFIEIVTADGLPRPYVTGINPRNAATGVRRDISVVATVNVTNGGIRGDTINSNTVFLTRSSDGALIPAVVNTSGGGDVITLKPSNVLEPNVGYTFNVTDGVLDAAGQPFVPFTSSFTTGISGGVGGGGSSIAFQQVRGPLDSLLLSSLAIGPDNQLYVSTLTGEIQRYAIAGDGTLGTPTVINTIRSTEVTTRAIIGMAFDPASTADNLVLWVSHNGPYIDENADDWTGQISRLSGPNLETIQDYVVNLPHSFKDHMANSIAFGPDGALYISVGSNSAMGAADNAWGNRPERLLSASILRINLSAISAPPLDVKTEAGGSYDPYAAGAPVTLYATGVRNAYDLAWHSNGQLYSAANGSAAGGNVPATPPDFASSPACQRRGYTGPAAPGVNGAATQKDWLFRVVQGGYYGHPNPLRCEWLMNGGNPTAATEANELAEYPVGTTPDPNYRGFAYDFDYNKSPNGMIEYTSDNFGGALKGKLIVVRWSGEDDLIVLEPGGSNQDIVGAIEKIPGMTSLTNPLDIIEDKRNGNLYVVEFGPPSRITLLKPLGSNVALAEARPTAALFTDVADGVAGPTQQITLENAGTQPLTVTNIALLGTDAGQFQIANPPASVAPRGTATFDVIFNPTTTGPKAAIVQVSSNAANGAQLEVTVRGLGTAGVSSTTEPSLQWVLDTYGIPVAVGDPDPTNNAMPSDPLLGQEVAVAAFERADNANPVLVEALAVFSPTDRDPVVRVGWYSSLASSTKSELFSVDNDPTSNGQQIAPPLQIGSSLNFDPGTAVFGFYGTWATYNNRNVYSEDALNTFSGALPHQVRVYPLKDESGAVVQNAYILAFEAEGTNIDYQDTVIIVRNVRPAQSLSGWLYLPLVRK
jgi:hypothetical protein